MELNDKEVEIFQLIKDIEKNIAIAQKSGLEKDGNKVKNLLNILFYEIDYFDITVENSDSETKSKYIKNKNYFKQKYQELKDNSQKVVKEEKIKYKNKNLSIDQIMDLNQQIQIYDLNCYLNRKIG